MSCLRRAPADREGSSRCRSKAETAWKCTLCSSWSPESPRSQRSSFAFSSEETDPELPALPWAEAGLERKSWDSKLNSFSAPAASH